MKGGKRKVMVMWSRRKARDGQPCVQGRSEAGPVGDGIEVATRDARVYKTSIDFLQYQVPTVELEIGEIGTG